MMSTLFRRLPPVARRDAAIRALSVERGRPSFGAKLQEACRRRDLLGLAGDRHAHPVWTLNDKVSGYLFALSHGVPIPQVYAEHARAREIEWDALPDEFAVKAVSGTASNGVLPLRRRGDGFVDLLHRDARVWSADEVVTHLETQGPRGEPSHGVIVEELLSAPAGSPSSVLPDYKLVCFHGTVGMIVAVGRRFRGSGGQVYRYFGPDGSDLGDVRAGVGSTHSEELPAPRHLAELLAAGERLSRAIHVPFVRIDMYEKPSGIVFGEITPAPGGEHVLRPDIDEALGSMWEQAECELELAAITAGIRHPDRGPWEARSVMVRS